MLNRLFGFIILIAFAFSIWTIYSNIGFIEFNLSSDLALLAAFIFPILLLILSFASMGLYVLGRDGSGAEFGVMLSHVIGFSAMLVVMLSLYFSVSYLFLENIQEFIPLILLAVASIIFILVWSFKHPTTVDEEANRRNNRIVTGVFAVFLISLLAICYIIGDNSPDLFSAVKGGVLLFLVFPAFFPLLLITFSGWSFLVKNRFSQVSDPEIYFPYILYLVFAIIGAVFGAAGFITSSVV